VAWVRLRQVALVTPSLDRVVSQLGEQFGLRVAYHDPSVAMFGLRNAVLPVGSQFIEVLCPLPGHADTSAERQMRRLGGDGGYMVICHTDDQAPLRARADELGVRVAFEAEEHGYRILQLHPRDTGGSFLEVDYQPGGEDPLGPWTPAGPDWRSAVCTDVVSCLTGVTVASTDVTRTATTWSRLLGVALEGSTLRLDNATVTFVAGPVDALVGVSVAGPPEGASWEIGGVRFSAAGTA
jgi:hypothetical protein